MLLKVALNTINQTKSKPSFGLVIHIWWCWIGLHRFTTSDYPLWYLQIFLWYHLCLQQKKGKYTFTLCSTSNLLFFQEFWLKCKLTPRELPNVIAI
jgi:hypothetical protein